MLNSIRDCFVTGKWEEGQDAATLLKEDGKKRSSLSAQQTYDYRLTVNKNSFLFSVEPSVEDE